MMEIMMLKNSFDQLKKAIENLQQRISNAPCAFIASESGEFLVGYEGIHAAKAGIEELFYSDECPDGRYTSVCLGAVGLTPDDLHAVAAVNQAKDEFRLACKWVLDNAKGRRSALLAKTARSKKLRELLVELGLARLSLKQCYRHLIVLNKTPSSIRFSYSPGGRSIKKISVSQALDILERQKANLKQVEKDREALQRLSSDTPLAQVQDLCGYYKANVLYEPGLPPETIPTFMPIFYPYSAEQAVSHQPWLPVRDDSKSRNRRSDVKISNKAEALSIRVYGYNA